MILEDAQEFTAVDNPAYLLGSRTSLVQALSKYTVPSVKIYTTLDPNTKAVSFKWTVCVDKQVLIACILIFVVT